MMVVAKEGTYPIQEDHKFSRNREFLSDRQESLSETH